MSFIGNFRLLDTNKRPLNKHTQLIRFEKTNYLKFNFFFFLNLILKIHFKNMEKLISWHIPALHTTADCPSCLVKTKLSN